MIDRPCKILLVEDSDGDASVLGAYLREEGGTRPRLERVVRLSEALEALTRRSYDIVLLDLNLPDSTGIETLDRVLEQDPDAPVVVLTGHPDRELALETVHRGAQDYLVKDRINADALLRVIRYSLERYAVLQRLRELDRLKTSFVSMASHEMRTPLAIIREFVSLVRDGVSGPVQPDQVECLDSALRNCDRLAELIDDLLDLGRIESGKLRLRRTGVDVASLLREIHGDFVPRCSSRNQDVVLEIDENLPAALADRERVNQVLFNLVGNAHKFTPEGGTITMRASRRDGTIRVEVEDTGAGIAETDRELVFEAFSQLDRRDRPGAQGTGLGLTIARSIIQMHGGSLELDSAPGHGSRFYFDLPAYAAGAELPAFVEDRWRIAKSIDKPSCLVLLRVLTADDETLEQVLENAKATLRGQDDDAVLVTASRTVALFLEADEAGTRVALGRLSAMLAERLGSETAFEYAVSSFDNLYSPEDWLSLARRKLAPMGTVRPARELKRVLVVDDEEVILGVMVEALEKSDLPIKVQSTVSGYDACVRYGDFDPHLVILDIHLKDIDGTEVFKAMRRGARGSVTKFLAVSGLVSRIDEMVKLGCDDKLVKPFEMSKLVETVANLLGIGAGADVEESAESA